MRQLFLILPLVLPTLLYAAYAIVRHRTAGHPWWRSAPWLRLALGGIVLMAAGLIAFVGQSDAPAGGVYEPAHVEDGRVVPGRFVRPEPRP